MKTSMQENVENTPGRFQFYDQVFIRETLEHVSEKIIQASISGVRLLFRKYVVFVLNTCQKGNLRLYFSLEKFNPFFIYSDQRMNEEIIYDRSNFVDFLNKVLQHARITRIVAKNNIIYMTIVTMYEEFQEAEIIYEVDTKYSNLLLVRKKDMNVIACSSDGGERDLERGAEYIPQEPGKADVSGDINWDELQSRYDRVFLKLGDKVKSWLSIISSFSFLHLKALDFKFDRDVYDLKAKASRAGQMKRGFFMYSQSGRCFPYLFRWNDTDSEYNDLGELYSEYIRSMIRNEYLSRSDSLKRKIHQRRRTLEKLSEEIVQNRPDPLKAEHYQQIGCSLLACGNKKVERAEIEIENQFNQTMEKVQCVIGMTCAQNAEKYFKKARKEKKKGENFYLQIEDIKRRIAYYLELEFNIDSEVDFALVESLQQQLFKKTRSEKSAVKTKNKGSGNFTRFMVLADGIEWICYLARNAVQNEKLLSNIARSEDFWLHSFEVPGGHIIVKNNDRRSILPEEVLEPVCQIAGYFSRYKNDEYAVIAHTQVKYLSRPPAHPPGFVIMNRFETRRVRTGQKEDVEKMIQSRKR